MSSFPGLNFVASVLWREFLRIYQGKFADFRYNVTVGQGIAPPQGASAEDAALWKRLTQKRIDVVAETLDSTWIIEIDERPGARTFGQLRLYKHMYPIYYQLSKRMTGALVCRYIGYDMMGAFLADADLVFKFQPGRPPQFPPTFLPPNAGVNFTLIGS